MEKTIEELQLENLELQEELKLTKETLVSKDLRIKSLEETNSKLYNKVVVGYKEPIKETKKIQSLDSFVNEILGGNKK